MGFSGHHDAGLNRLAAPFEKFTDSPKNQHLLQTAFTLHMFRKTFPSLAPTSRGLLVRIVDRGIEVTALEQRFARTAAAAARRFKR